MTGTLPPAAVSLRVVGGETLFTPIELRAPSVGEVVVEAAGSAVSVGLGPRAGCEVAGTVVAAGEAAGDWLGRAVIVPRHLPCGECDRCRRGQVALCRSPAPRVPFASHETLPAQYLLPVEPPLRPEGVPLAHLAALSDAASAPWGALVRAQLAPNDLCAILGAGPRGRFAAAIAVAKGARAVVIDDDPARRETSLRAGAHAVLDGTELDAPRLAALLAEQAGALGLATFEPKIIETSSTAAGRARAVALSASGMTAVLLDGGDGTDGPLPRGVLGELAASEGTLLGASACHPDLLPELLALVVRGDLRLAPEVSLHDPATFADVLRAVRTGRLRTLPVLNFEAHRSAAPPAR